MVKKEYKYCPFCNFKESKLIIENANYDYKCPNCREVNISNFYSIGSTMHKRVLNGEVHQDERTRVVPPQIIKHAPI